MANQRTENLVNMLDAYVGDGGYHLNVNVFNRETLLDGSIPKSTRSSPSA